MQNQKLMKIWRRKENRIKWLTERDETLCREDESQRFW